jgi:hypothetical protein
LGKRPDLTLAVEIPKVKMQLYFGVWLNDDGSVGAGLSKKVKDEDWQTVAMEIISNKKQLQKIVL